MNGRWCVKAALDQNSKFEGLLLSRCVLYFFIKYILLHRVAGTI